MQIHNLKATRQRGALFVEAALVIPFFIYLVINLIYFSFMLHDYMSLNNLTRNAVRYAAVASSNSRENDGEATTSAASKKAKVLGYLTNNGSSEAMILYKLSNSNFTTSETGTVQEFTKAGGQLILDGQEKVTVALAASREEGEIPLLVDNVLPLIITSSLTMKLEQ